MQLSICCFNSTALFVNTLLQYGSIVNKQHYQRKCLLLKKERLRKKYLETPIFFTSCNFSICARVCAGFGNRWSFSDDLAKEWGRYQYQYLLATSAISAFYRLHECETVIPEIPPTLKGTQTLKNYLK